MAHRAVIFDLDGTLLDTLDDLANSMNAVLRRLGLPEHDREAYKYFVGSGMEELVRRALPADDRNDGRLVANAFSAMRDEYTLRRRENTKPYEGVADLLDGLAERRIAMAILTNKPHDQSQLVVAEFLSAWKFDAVVGAGPSTPLKPDPAGALGIAAHLEIPPREFVYLGDSDIDMLTATVAGMYAVGALWGFRKAEELLAGGAMALIKSPTELLQLT